MNLLNGTLLGLSLLLVAQDADKPCPPCEPGYQWVEEVRYKEVVRYVCKMVPEVKKVKKIVYTPKEEPFCVRRATLFGGHKQADCGECTRCKGPYKGTILVKTEITCEEPTTKCVTEKVVEKVPYVVRRKVPCCDVLPPTCAIPAPGTKP